MLATIQAFFSLFFFFGFFLLIFTLIIISNKENKKLKSNEIKEIENYCSINGLKYKNHSNNLPKCSEEFKLISRGDNYNYVMIGNNNGFEYSILDYNYSQGKNNRAYNTICLVSKEGVSLPEFCLMSKWTCLFYPNSCGNQVFTNKQLLNTYHLITDNVINVKNLFNSKFCNMLEKNISKKYEYETKGEYLLVFVKGGKNLYERLNMLDQAIKLYSAMIENE